ncbi:MAG: alpha/beta hydrolase, partial [Desulfobacterales bacterium]|nr:alpha/beta hydrolase [Desulfobacterales bacterium]
HMPETLVLTAEFDPLRDEGFLYCEKLKAHGVRAERHCFPGMVHAFLNLEDLVQEEAAELYGRIADFLQSA